MSTFKLLVRGRNFRLPFEEGGGTIVKQTGFYVWRAVQAASPADAEVAVMALLRAAPQLRCFRNTPDDPPVMFVDELRQLPEGEDLDSLNRSGFIFFHGRGAGRPRAMLVAARRLLPKAVRRAADRLWRRSRTRSSPQHQKA